VIDRLIELERSAGVETVFLKGNHEDMFLAWLGQPGHYGDAFLLNGGRITLASYGLTPQMEGSEALEALPAEHLGFLRGLRLYDCDPPFLFVHAGISPLHDLENQDEEDLLWIREEFIRNRHRLPYTVIFGHTPQREVLWHMPFKIGIDTGCVYGNKLSCLDLTSATLHQVERDARRVTQRDVSKELAQPSKT
jgi:serine/threonine protein phosphatase 1